MAKKKLVDVDEEMLKGIMVGDVPVFGRKTKSDSISQVEVKDSIYEGTVEPGIQSEVERPAKDHEEQQVEKEKKTAYKNVRKSPDIAAGYREQFLVNAPSSSRAQTYINRDVYELVKRFLPVIAPNISISGYISNILVEHLDRYWIEIDKIYNEENSKPLKR